MLLACETCHRVYDVKDLSAGRKVRCTCGQVNTVAQPVAIRAQMAHCGTCGGALALDAKSCGYCQARVTLLEEQLGDPCPHCMARLPAGARFCPACGQSIEAAGIVQALSDSSCPVCRTDMQVVDGPRDPFHQCGTCGGLWLSSEALERFLDEVKGTPATLEERRAVSKEVKLGRRLKPEALGLACPVCRNYMFRHEFARYSRVVVDQCRSHGWWFDANELEGITRFVRAGGLQLVEERERVRRRSQRVGRAWRRRVAEERRHGSGDLFELLADLIDD